MTYHVVVNIVNHPWEADGKWHPGHIDRFLRTEGIGREEDARVPFLALYKKFHGKLVNQDSDLMHFEVRLERECRPRVQVTDVPTDNCEGAWLPEEFEAYREDKTVKEARPWDEIPSFVLKLSGPVPENFPTYVAASGDQYTSHLEDAWVFYRHAEAVIERDRWRTGPYGVEVVHAETEAYVNAKSIAQPVIGTECPAGGEHVGAGHCSGCDQDIQAR